MASNTAALGVQRGVLSHISSVEPPRGGAGAPLRPTASGVTHSFSSPAQRNATQSMTERFSQVSSHAVHDEDDPDLVRAIAELVVTLNANPMTPLRRTPR